MRAALLIAAKDLRLRVRDRSAFLMGLVVPFGLALVFSLILGGASGSGALDLQYGVVDGDGSSISQAFVTALQDVATDGLFELTTPAGEEEARADVESGELDAAFVIPRGFGASVESGAAADLTVVGHVDRPTSSSIAQSIAGEFVARIQGTRLAAITAAGAGLDVADVVSRVRTEPPPVAITAIEAADRQLEPTTFFVAGMAVFFLFFTVSFGVTSLLEERREGTMARLLAAPISRGSVVGAKAIVSVALGIVSMVVLVVASTLLLGAEWGDPLGVALLIVSGVISAVGIMAVVAAFARTPEGAANLQAVIAVGLGMLGGVFFPAPLGQGLLASLALLTPHRWFMTGLGDLAGGGGVAVVLPSVLALLAFGLVTAALAATRLRKAVLA